MISTAENGFLDGKAPVPGDRTVAIKDTIDIAGQPTGAGSPAFRDAPAAARDAEVVARLRAAGWRIAGKTRLHEIAYGVSGLNPWQGTAPNPLFPDLIPGGSSSGSASVVAAGLAEAALGTDTGGSVRIPAACCGVIGLKPGFGTVSRAGVLPAESSLDCVGIFTRTLAPLAEVLRIVAERPAAPEPGGGLRGARLRPPTDPLIEARLDAALTRSGLEIAEADLPGFAAAFDAGMTIIAAENARAFGHLLGRGLFGPDIEARLEAATRIGAEALAEAEAVRSAFRAGVERLFTFTDLLFLPTLTCFPPSLAEQVRDPTAANLTNTVRPFNLSGHPAIALPLEPVDGKPVSLQIVGPMGSDLTLIAAASRIRPDLA